MFPRMLSLLCVVAAAGVLVGGVNGTERSTKRNVEENTRIVVGGDQVRSAQQAPLGFRPFGNLHALPESDYTNLGHPSFPRYNVRIKTSHFCDGTVKAHTGYIDVEARHLFFYYFESRRDPAQDDVVFWTNGGPGGSSAVGLFMELGPCRISGPNETVYNPYGWNEYVNMLFVDQPIGTGFSYADHGEFTSTAVEAAKDIAAFVAIFFEHFNLTGRPFHLSGESYAGRFLPVFAAEIVDQNPELEASGITPINLASLMIGNGCTDWATLLPSYHDMMCQNITVPPVLDIKTCVHVKNGMSRCTKWFQEECRDRFDKINCKAAMAYCTELIAIPYSSTGLSPHDLTLQCGSKGTEGICYEATAHINHYLSKPEVRKEIGVDPSVPEKFLVHDPTVKLPYDANLDHQFPTQYYLAALLERGIRVLIFVGANDWICNWVGNERMALALEWSGQEQFNQQSFDEWYVGGRAAGKVRSFEGLVFATIYGAGHMAPYDKPEEALELVRRWIAEESL